MISQEDIRDMAPEPGHLPIAIGLAGAAGAGKSTAAAAIWKMTHTRERQTHIVKMAGPLKDMMRAMYDYTGVDWHQVEDRIEGALKEAVDPILGGLSPRIAMQRLGTDWGRNLIHPDLWTSLWQHRVRYLADQYAGNLLVVTDDVRFPNEAQAIRELGGVVIGVLGNRGSSLQDGAAGHESERGLKASDVDAIVVNGPDTTPEQLAGLVLNAAAEAAAHPRSHSGRPKHEDGAAQGAAHRAFRPQRG
jgi:hypothetical protein